MDNMPKHFGGCVYQGFFIDSGCLNLRAKIFENFFVIIGAGIGRFEDTSFEEKKIR